MIFINTELYLSSLLIHMKKVFFLLSVVVMAIMFGAASIPAGLSVKQTPKKSSACGYRIIEFGVGLNCNGDTVKLVRSMGFQRLASQEEDQAVDDKQAVGSKK